MCGYVGPSSTGLQQQVSTIVRPVMEGEKREGGGGMPPRPKFVSLFHFLRGRFFSPFLFCGCPQTYEYFTSLPPLLPAKEGGREGGRGKGKGKHMQETEQKGRGTKKCLFPPLQRCRMFSLSSFFSCLCLLCRSLIGKFGNAALMAYWRKNIFFQCLPMGRIFAKTWMIPLGEGFTQQIGISLDPFGRSGKPSIVFSPF